MSASNPQVRIRWSDDGGYTWSKPRYIALGKVGAYKQLARAWRLGSGRNRVYEVVYTENTQFNLMGAQLDLTIPPGTN